MVPAISRLPHAPGLRSLSTGEELLRGRCAACDTVRGDDLADRGHRRVGQDLMNVSRRRDHDWLPIVPPAPMTMTLIFVDHA